MRNAKIFSTCSPPSSPRHSPHSTPIARGEIVRNVLQTWTANRITCQTNLHHVKKILIIFNYKIKRMYRRFLFWKVFVFTNQFQTIHFVNWKNLVDLWQQQLQLALAGLVWLCCCCCPAWHLGSAGPVSVDSQPWALGQSRRLPVEAPRTEIDAGQCPVLASHFPVQ